MITKYLHSTDFISHNKVFAWLALAVGALLTVPLIAMQLSTEVNWDLFDFIAAGILLFGTGALFIIIARRVPKTNARVVLGVVLAIALCYLWAELAVGIFTNWGS